MNTIQKYKKVAFYAILLMLNAYLFASRASAATAKPTPFNDTFSTGKGSPQGYNLLANDTGLNKIITKFMVKTTSYTITKGVEKLITIAGVGTIKVNSTGKCVFTPECNFMGAWPAISYTLNNDLTGNGKTAKIFVKTIIVPRILFGHAVDTSYIEMGMKDGKVQIWRGGNLYRTGDLKMAVDARGKVWYWIEYDLVWTGPDKPLYWLISEFEYYVLKDNE